MTEDATAMPEPISVKAHAAPVVMSEGTRIILIAGFAAAADHFMHSDIAIGAVVAAGGALATAVWSLWSRLHNWKVLRIFANLLPDDVATVGKPPQ